MTPSETMAHQQSLETIEIVLQQLRPMIMNDGGNIELVKYEKNIVYVRLLGACVHCPVSMFTLKLGVEEALKQKFPDLQEVVAIE